VGVCPNCGKETQAFRRKRAACRRCCDAYAQGKFDARFVLQYERQRSKVSQTPLPDGLNRQALGDSDDVGAFKKEALAYIRHWEGIDGEAKYHIGKKLIEVKDKLGHGTYESMVTVDLGYKASTARFYVQLAKAPDGLELAKRGSGLASLWLRLPLDQRTPLLRDPAYTALSYRALQAKVDCLLGRAPTPPRLRTPVVPISAVQESTDAAWAAGVYHGTLADITPTWLEARDQLLRGLFDPAAGLVPDDSFLVRLHRAKEILQALLVARAAA